MARATAQAARGLAPVPVFDRGSVVADIVQRLLDYIVGNGIEPGEKLPTERQLAEALGIGRGSVREAIKSLEMLGVVDSRQGAGTYLRGNRSSVLPKVMEWGLLLGRPKVRELIEARFHIETTVAGLAAERYTPETGEQLDAALARMREAEARGDASRFVEADVAFHMAIAESAQNWVLADMLRSIRSLLHVWVARIVDNLGIDSRSLQLHERIVKAIKTGDAEKARRAMANHMRDSGKRLLAAVEQAED